MAWLHSCILMANLAIIEECMTRGWKRSMTAEKDCCVIPSGKHGHLGRDVKLRKAEVSRYSCISYK